jgi:hypothetical protein
MRGNSLFDLSQIEGARLESIGPGSARVQRIPVWSLALVTSGTWIMVAKSIQDDIPKRLITFDDQRLSQRDPEFVDNKVSAQKVPYVEVLGLPDRCSVL